MQKTKNSPGSKLGRHRHRQPSGALADWTIRTHGSSAGEISNVRSCGDPQEDLLDFAAHRSRSSSTSRS